jgi:hypothetical protein
MPERGDEAITGLWKFRDDVDLEGEDGEIERLPPRVRWEAAAAHFRVAFRTYRNRLHPLWHAGVFQRSKQSPSKVSSRGAGRLVDLDQQDSSVAFPPDRGVAHSLAHSMRLGANPRSLPKPPRSGPNPRCAPPGSEYGHSMAEEQWSRKCGECGRVDPAASYPSKELAEERVYAGSEDNPEEQLPRCSECGSLDMEAILVSDPPEPRSAGVA